MSRTPEAYIFILSVFNPGIHKKVFYLFMSDLVKLEHVLGIAFHNRHLLKEAMTHKSFAAEHKIPYDNQRLELLGDAVLQIVMTRYLFDRYPDLQEGALTQIRSALVNQDSLAEFARSIDLGHYLMLGKGERELNGSDRDSTISDAFESFTGALYLDQGLEKAQEFFLSILLKHYPDPAETLTTLNPKGALQEYTQKIGAHVPQYKVLSVSGPDHNPRYEVQVSIREIPVASTVASSRKLAERDAAKKALDLLKRHVISLEAPSSGKNPDSQEDLHRKQKNEDDKSSSAPHISDIPVKS